MSKEWSPFYEPVQELPDEIAYFMESMQKCRNIVPNPLMTPYPGEERNQWQDDITVDYTYLGESSTATILMDLGEEENEVMGMSLNARKIKEVTIKCEDGKTYEGRVERIVGCPYDISSQELTVKVSKQASGNYGIKEVIFQNPATIVYWTDGTKTVVNCMDNAEIKKKIVDGKETIVRKPRKCDTYSKEVGLAMAISKKWAGNEGNYNKIFREFIPGIKESEKEAKKAIKKAKKEAAG